MNCPVTARIFRATLFGVMVFLMGATGCAHREPRLYAPLQADGWKVQPIAIGCRFAADADLDPATGTPVGDEGYYLYVLNEAADWNYSDMSALLISIWRQPWAHSWLILESPRERMEFGHTGDFGDANPRYHEGVYLGIKAGDPNPIAYLWRTMADGQLQIGKPNRPPSFVWRMPITRHRHQMINDYVRQRQYDQFGLSSKNCTDFVIEAAELAGINLAHRIRLTLPSETKIWGQMERFWTDPRYRVLDYSSPDVLEVDLRQLARLGIGSDVTKWYLGLGQ